MGKRKMSQPLRKVLPRVSKKGKAKRSITPRNCPKCLEKHKPPTGKRCQRLQTPGVRVGPDPLPGPPGLFASSSSAETLSADDIRLAPVRFLSVSSTDESTPPRQPEDGMNFAAAESGGSDDTEDYPTEPDYDDGEFQAQEGEQGEYCLESDEQDDQPSDSQSEGEGEEEPSEGTMQHWFTEFDRVTAQILSRLDRSEKNAASLEETIRVRDEQLARAHAALNRHKPPPQVRFHLPTERPLRAAASTDAGPELRQAEMPPSAPQAVPLEESGRHGYVPPPRLEVRPPDERFQQLVLMTPEDYSFPSPTKVAEFSADPLERQAVREKARKSTGRVTGLPLLPKPTFTDALPRTSSEDQPSRDQGRGPTMAPKDDMESGPRVWDPWDMSDRTRYHYQTAGQPTASAQPTVAIPAVEQPSDLRADPFLTCRAEAALHQPTTAETAAAGRNKSGLTRTAQDAAKIEIMWPHHRVWRGTTPVAYNSLTPWEFIFSYLSMVKEMQRSEYVLTTMMRILYNFALASTKHDWASMREAFQAVLLELEAGTLTWADVGPINLLTKQVILDNMARPVTADPSKQRAPPKASNDQNSLAKRKPRVCNRFQKEGTCNEQATHTVGRWTYHHACVLCLKKTGELLPHPAHICTRQQATEGAAQPKKPRGPSGVSRDGPSYYDPLGHTCHPRGPPLRTG